MLIKAYGASDIGKFRDENQDRFLIDDGLGLYAVADGMGGLANGAATAARTLEMLSARMRDKSLGHARVRDVYAHITNTLDLLNADIRMEMTGGSTLVFVFVAGNRAFFVNAGDSPGFLYRDGKLAQMTKDHNVAGVLADMGRLSREEARVHPTHNQLTSFIGTGAPLESSIREIEIKAGDRLLLCSDGLTGMVGDQAIENVLAAEKEPLEAVEKLIGMANAAGGYDNVTAVLADVTD